MEILRPKVYHRKSAFFEMTKKMKIGRRWPKSSGTVTDGFWTSLQKHLTPFHNKIMLLSSILKKISPTKRSSLFEVWYMRFLFSIYMCLFKLFCTNTVCRCHELEAHTCDYNRLAHATFKGDF